MFRWEENIISRLHVTHYSINERIVISQLNPILSDILCSLIGEKDIQIHFNTFPPSVRCKSVWFVSLNPTTTGLFGC